MMPQGNIPHFSVRRLIKIHERVDMLTLYYRFSQVNEAAYPAEHRLKLMELVLTDEILRFTNNPI